MVIIAHNDVLTSCYNVQSTVEYFQSNIFKRVAKMQEEELTEEKREEKAAETRLNNTRNELRRIKESIDALQQDIDGKRDRCNQIQEQADTATSLVLSLEEKDTVLQEKQRKTKQRLTLSKDTLYEEQEREILQRIVDDIESNKQAYLQARVIQDEAQKALEQIDIIQTEIAPLLQDLAELERSHAEMQALYQENWDLYGIRKMRALKRSIEDKEQAVRDAELALKQAKDTLLTEQRSIYPSLCREWPKRAEMLYTTHGPKTSSRTTFEGEACRLWLHLVEFLRDHGRELKSMMRTYDNQLQPTVELLQLSAQDIIDFSKQDNWRELYEFNARHERERILHNQRYDVVKQALKNYE
jgi:hypothetical protein